MEKVVETAWIENVVYESLQEDRQIAANKFADDESALLKPRIDSMLGPIKELLAKGENCVVGVYLGNYYINVGQNQPDIHKSLHDGIINWYIRENIISQDAIRAACVFVLTYNLTALRDLSSLVGLIKTQYKTIKCV